MSDQTHDQHEHPDQQTALVPIPGTDGYQKTIAIDPDQPMILSVTNATGAVEIIGTDHPDVRIVARRRDGEARAADESGVALTVDGNHISLRPAWQSVSGLGDTARAIKDHIQAGLSTGKWDFSGMPKIGMNAEYDFQIRVPRAPAAHSRIAIKTASGAAAIRDVTADVTIGSASGDVDATALSGQVAIHTASGDVEARDITGSLEVNSASGDVSVRGGDAWTAVRTMSGDLALSDTTLRNARITTVSGDLAGAVTLDNAADYTFETVSGDLSLTCRLPIDATSRLSFRSISGDAEVGDGWTATGKREWTAGDGPDGPAIKTRSVSGDLQLRGASDAGIHLRHEAARAPQPAAPTEAEQSQSGLDEIKSYAAQAREMAEEMKRMFTGPAAPQPPAPPAPVPPAPPRPQADLDAEQARRDSAGEQQAAEQTSQGSAPTQPDREQPHHAEPPAPPAAPSAQDAAGHSGDWWVGQAGPEARSTAPIAQPAPAQPSAQATEPIRSAAMEETDPARRHVLDQVERGEIDIEEALNRLEQSDGKTI